MVEKHWSVKDVVKGYINHVIKSSIVDGPGNRIAIFMQGCNFDCWYCHNPETINMCNDCKQCLSTCKVNALSFNETMQYDITNCVHCNACVETCNHDSSPKISIYTPRELYESVSKYFDFVEGITFSGGEALLQQDFIIEFFKLVKANTNLTCFVDTNGSIAIKQELIDYTDYFMLDVKAFDNEEHMRVCKHSNELVLNNLKKLCDLNKLYEVRTVLYPGYDHTPTIEYVESIINNKINYKKIKYHSTGVRAQKNNA